MLFGETCAILEEKPRWNRIKLDMDGQEGWVDSKMIASMTDEEYKIYCKDFAKSARVVFPIAYAVSENNGQTIPLTAGTRLTNYQNGHFELLGVGFKIDANMVSTNAFEMTEANLLQATRFFLNVPYLWGGKNALGMDCSGFTQTIMGLFGKQLLRNASEQATQGDLVDNLKIAKAGDLAFFDHNDGRISHVGILIDSERVIHCSGRVKVEKIDEQGLPTHHLVQIRRYG